MKDWKTASRYANALLRVSVDSNQLDTVYEDVKKIQNIVHQNADLVHFLKNPVIANAQKKETFKALFERSVSKPTLDFLYLLCTKNRESLLDEIISSFISKRDELLGHIKAAVTTVVDMTPDQIVMLTDRIKSMTGKIPELSFDKDPELIGGFIVRIGDQVIDGSVRHQLEKLREQFLD